MKPERYFLTNGNGAHKAALLSHHIGQPISLVRVEKQEPNFYTDPTELIMANFTLSLLEFPIEATLTIL